MLAADVGGTSIRAAKVGDDGTILDRRAAPTPADPREGIALLRRFFDELGEHEGAAVAIAGTPSPDDGTLVQSPNLKRWEGTRPGAELDAHVLNDANAALLGEAWLGGLAGKRSALLLTLGTGVGGGLLLDGRLWSGSCGSAGEIGHTTIRPDGPPCPCGGRGCLELYASATAVAKAAGTTDAEEAERIARGGEPRARGAFDQAGRALGIALANVANLLAPDAFCIGGGMTPAFDLLLPALRRELDARAFRLARERLEIVPARLGGDAGLLGAAYHALHAR